MIYIAKTKLLRTGESYATTEGITDEIVDKNLI